jgi:hypothetical protein
MAVAAPIFERTCADCLDVKAPFAAVVVPRFPYVGSPKYVESGFSRNPLYVGSGFSRIHN